MKLFAKLMIAVLFIAMLLPFTILKGPDGRPLMSFTDFSLPEFSMPDLPDMPKLPKSSKLDSSSESLDGKDIFYKWYDAKGNVQFTTEPPADGIEYTVKGYDPDTNLIQAVEIPEEKIEKPEPPPAAEPEVGGLPYSKEGVEKLINDVKNIEELLNQRARDQESALNQ